MHTCKLESVWIVLHITMQNCELYHDLFYGQMTTKTEGCWHSLSCSCYWDQVRVSACIVRNKWMIVCVTYSMLWTINLWTMAVLVCSDCNLNLFPSVLSEKKSQKSSICLWEVIDNTSFSPCRISLVWTAVCVQMFVL